MRILSVLVLCFGCLAVSPVFSQKNPPVRFEWSAEFFSDNFQAIRQNPGVSPDELVNGHYVRYLQCAEIPAARQRAEAEASGLQFIGYVSFGAYLVAVPAGFDLGRLAPLGVRSIVPVRPEWKLGRSLREQPFGEWAVQGDHLRVYLQVYPHIGTAQGAEMCRRAGIAVLEEGNQNGILHVLLHPDAIVATADLPFVRRLELAPRPPQTDDTGGRALHRANLLDMEHPLGNKYDGTGVSVLVRDDGPLGPHIDFQGRQNDIFGPNDFTDGTHGDGVAGILAGAGNINPTMRGMAAGATIFNIRYRADFLDNTLDLHKNQNVTITNSSYAEDCNEGYTVNTETVERQLFENPTLMHVFSAGNAGENNCNYGAGPTWGNITGGHKMAKNALAVANLSADGSLYVTSSRGPAHDGRLKPDIAAHGHQQNSTDRNNGYRVFGGTSAAAPGVAGCMAQLTQAYRETNNGNQPDAALLKAAMLNTANDLGNPGPDFQFGWGHINAARAYQLLSANRWTEKSVDQSAVATHAISVPAGTRQVRIMAYWSDPPASPAAARALINDLDLTVLAPDGSTVYLPWLLDPTPDPVNLSTPASTGRDSLNNAEQVAIANPAPGTYTVRVRGHEVPLGPQPFFLVWEFYDDRPRLTYPAGGEGLVPGETCRIQWDALGDTGNFSLQYSPNNGGLWAQIATPPGDARMHDWTVPNAANGQIRVRVIRGNFSDTTDFPLTIAPVPANLQVQRVCPDSMTVSWSPVTDTLGYDVYLLGEKYMTIVGQATDTEFTFPIQNPGQEQWVSVRAVGPNGLAGRRALAVEWPGSLKNCQQPDDLAAQQLHLPDPAAIANSISCSPIQSAVQFRCANEGLNPASGAVANYRLNNDPVVSEPLPDLAPGALLDFTFQQPVWFIQNGANTLRVWISYAPEDVFFNDTLVQQFHATVAPMGSFFTEDFQEPIFPPLDWAVGNPDGKVTWDRTVTSIVGASGQSTQVTFINCYNYPSYGQQDYLYLPPLDLGNLPKPGIFFDLAHANYDNTYRDSLRLEVFTNCDLTATPVVVWGKAGTELATREPVTAAYAPGLASDWRKEGVSLEAFAGQKVIVRFASVNDFGNNIFLDNIALAEYALTQPVAKIAASTAGPVCRLDTVRYTAQNLLANTSYNWLFGVGAQPVAAAGPGPHAVRYSTSGNKTVQLIASNAAGSDTAFLEMPVLGMASANFSWTTDKATVTFSNTSTYSESYLWNFGDGNSSTESNPVHTYAQPGTYTVTLTASNSCTTTNSTRTLSLLLTFVGTDTPDGIGQVQVLPNPTAGDFRVEMTCPEAIPIQLSLFDTQGRQLKTRQVDAQAGPNIVRFDGLSLPAGLYRLQVQTERGVRTFSVTVQ
ncbi:MAG: S8 family serine peptidase [Saprospiraceae bacterium]